MDIRIAAFQEFDSVLRADTKAKIVDIHDVAACCCCVDVGLVVVVLVVVVLFEDVVVGLVVVDDAAMDVVIPVARCLFCIHDVHMPAIVLLCLINVGRAVVVRMC